MYKESVHILTKGINNSADNLANLYYNRACSYIKLDEFEKSMSDLKKSVEINNNIAEYAKNDEDFKNIRKNDIFIKIIGD